MQNIITIKDFYYRYDEKSNYIFNKISLNLKKGSFTTLVGPIGSGKSTLVKILLGLIKVDGYIKIDDVMLNSNNIKEIRSKIGVVFENSDETFVGETVMDEISVVLENIGFPKKEIRKRIRKLLEDIGIGHLIQKEVQRLSSGEKQLVSLARAIASNPKIIILDEAFTMVDELEKRKIFEILKELNKEKEITILNITHDLDESLYGNDIVLLHDGKIILQGTKEEVLKEEQIIKKAGLKIPFLVDLSIRLQYYGLLDHMVLDMNEMVNIIWK